MRRKGKTLVGKAKIRDGKARGVRVGEGEGEEGMGKSVVGENEERGMRSKGKREGDEA